MSRKNNQAIISIVHKEWGLYDAKDGAIVLTDMTPKTLGQTIVAAMKPFREVPFDTNAPAKSMPTKEWPPLLISGLKTMKSFSQEYMRVSVKGANSANIIYLMETYYMAEEVRLSASSGNDEKSIGQILLMLQKYYHKFEDRIESSNSSSDL